MARRSDFGVRNVAARIASLPSIRASSLTSRALSLSSSRGFPSDRYAAVIISLKYEDSAGYGVERSYRLGARHRPAPSAFVALPGSRGVCRFRLQYYPTAGAPITTDWQIATESIVVIDDPFPQNFLVRVYVAEPREELGWADISLRYEDPHLPGSYQEGRMFFDQDLKPQVWKVSAPDPRARRYQYRFTLFLRTARRSRLRTGSMPMPPL